MIQNTDKFKPAFSMITAIFVILLLSTVAAFILNLSGKSIDETTTQYRKEQAILYAKSYTEYAIMSAVARDCIKTITGYVGGTLSQVKAGNGYKVTVDIQYVGNELAGALGGTCDTLGGAISTTNSRGAIILVDTYVRYRNPDHPDAIAGVAFDNTHPGFVYHRRTIQRL